MMHTMLHAISHGESNWRSLCQALDLDPDTATAESVLTALRPAPAPPSPAPTLAERAEQLVAAYETHLGPLPPDARAQVYQAHLRRLTEAEHEGLFYGRPVVVGTRFEPYCESCGKPPMVCRCGEGEAG